MSVATETALYGGRTWHRIRGYFSATFRRPDGSMFRVLLHRRVWADAHGPIPAGHVVHHRDENTGNNSIENLELMERGAHNSMHKVGRLPATHKSVSFECRVCGRRVERKQTGEGKWCSMTCKNAAASARGYRSPKAMARRAALAEARAGRTCLSCAVPIDAKKSGKRFCSPRCAKRARRAKERACPTS